MARIARLLAVILSWAWPVSLAHASRVIVWTSQELAEQAEVLAVGEVLEVGVASTNVVREGDSGPVISR